MDNPAALNTGTALMLRFRVEEACFVCDINGLVPRDDPREAAATFAKGKSYVT
jgi:hypothetical protein